MLHWSVPLSFERILSMASFDNGHEAQHLAQLTGNDSRLLQAQLIVEM